MTANQLQIDSILASINRLAEATAFGDKKLLNGSLAFTTSGVNVNEPTGAAQNHLSSIQINAAKIAAGAFRQINVTRLTASTRAEISAVLGGTTGTSTTLLNGTLGAATSIQIRGQSGAELLSFASGTTAAAIVTAINDRSALTGVQASSFAGATGNGPASISFSSTDFGSDALVSISILENSGITPGDSMGVDAGTSSAVTKNGTNGVFTINGTNAVVNGLSTSVRAGDLSLDIKLSSDFGGGTSAAATSTFEITGGGARFSISPTVGLSGLESIGINEVSTARIGLSTSQSLATLGSGLANDLASKNFTTAQRIVRAAINTIASLRGRLGAFQKDTLQSTINSLRVANENITAAESAIRDADFAVETSALTRAQILVNSSTTILQLANAQPQNALALLG